MRGEESCPTAGSLDLRRVAALGVHGSVSPVAVGEPVHYIASSPQARCLSDQQALLWRGPDIAGASGGPSSGTGFSSGIAVPLLAHGMAMGLVTFTRTASSGPFEDEDAWLAEELARRTALCLDNARRFTRERAMVRALRRSLLPWNLPEQNAVEAAHCYMPARSGTSGDWYDVIPLSGARVALVVGEQCGRGPHSTAAMGRLRTTVGNFSALDMPPGDILGYLDDLVRGLDRESAGRAAQAGGEADGGTDAGADDGVTGTTCVYAVYDPASQRCTIASAGHPAPALVRPDGAVEFLEVPAGEPLGRGGPVFETAEVDLPEGSTIVLYTKGLIGEHAPPGQGGDRERLRRALTGAGRTAEQTCSALLDALPSGRMPGEFTVLAARTRALPRHCVAEWEVPPDPAAVGRIRDEVARRLAEWNLEELTFSAELIFSELVTNAIRYGSEPLGARLLLDRSLICEVSDAGETAPRPRRAADTDEGGRGLYLVAQLAERWGTRYTRRGKIIWAELPLGDGGCEPGAVPRPG
ncbi:ATP-binding SpoIIE family protein phosphatase [Thermocatellispora tengchongensis]|uniref:ATP-binding SpoIIE family protein phosphatase n=1 Tax=Thermocatellispora tengchongensis TaxID=1073253 RepID=UPI003626039E